MKRGLPRRRQVSHAADVDFVMELQCVYVLVCASLGFSRFDGVSRVNVNAAVIRPASVADVVCVGRHVHVGGTVHMRISVLHSLLCSRVLFETAIEKKEKMLI